MFFLCKFMLFWEAKYWILHSTLCIAFFHLLWHFCGKHENVYKYWTIPIFSREYAQLFAAVLPYSTGKAKDYKYATFLTILNTPFLMP